MPLPVKQGEATNLWKSRPARELPWGEIRWVYDARQFELNTVMEKSMKIALSALAILFTICAPYSGIQAQTTASSKDKKVPTISSVLDQQLSMVEKAVISAAEAMPEERYSFAPTSGEFKGVRTFGQQVKHIAWANNRFFGDILGEKLEAQVGMNGPDSMQTKDQILSYLRDSYTLGHRAIATITAENLVTQVPNPRFDFMSTRLALVVIACRHGFDIYGQMVEYLRMNGIVPPSSRQ
jgi:hypothetical protein